MVNGCLLPKIYPNSSKIVPNIKYGNNKVWPILRWILNDTHVPFMWPHVFRYRLIVAPFVTLCLAIQGANYKIALRDIWTFRRKSVTFLCGKFMKDTLFYACFVLKSTTPLDVPDILYIIYWQLKIPNASNGTCTNIYILQRWAHVDIAAPGHHLCLPKQVSSSLWYRLWKLPPRYRDFQVQGRTKTPLESMAYFFIGSMMVSQNYKHKLKCSVVPNGTQCYI